MPLVSGGDESIALLLSVDPTWNEVGVIVAEFRTSKVPVIFKYAICIIKWWYNYTYTKII